MKYIRILFMLFLTGLAPGGYAQQSDYSKHLVYGEFLGAGDLYSLNYEHRFRPNQSVRLGAGVFPENWYEGGVNEKTIMNVPLSYQYLIGKSRHHLEAIGGLISSFTFSKNQPSQCIINPDIAVGYRYHKPDKGFYAGLRVYLFMPWFLSIDKDEWLFYTGKSYYPAPGLCAGWSF